MAGDHDAFIKIVRDTRNYYTHYDPKLKERSRELRRNATFTERLLWKYLRVGQLNGYRFLRQKPIDEFIVDFYCKSLQLVIEIDGVSHNDKQRYDKRR